MSCTVTWNGTTIGKVFEAELDAAHEIQTYPSDDGQIAAINDQFPRNSAAVVWSIGQDNSAIETDRLAGTSRTMTFVFKNATQTLTITSTGCYCSYYSESRMIKEPIHTQCVFTLGHVTWAVA